MKQSFFQSLGTGGTVTEWGAEDEQFFFPPLISQIQATLHPFSGMSLAF